MRFTISNRFIGKCVESNEEAPTQLTDDTWTLGNHMYGQSLLYAMKEAANEDYGPKTPKGAELLRAVSVLEQGAAGEENIDVTFRISSRQGPTQPSKATLPRPSSDDLTIRIVTTKVEHQDKRYVKMGQFKIKLTYDHLVSPSVSAFIPFKNGSTAANVTKTVVKTSAPSA